MSAVRHEKWRSDRLKDISAINWSALPANTADEFTFRYLEISNVNSYGVISEEAMDLLQFADAPSRARRLVSAGDVLVSSVRPNLQAIAHADMAIEEPLVCSTGFNVVSPRLEKISDRYLYFFLLSEGTRQHFEAVAKGVGYPAIDDKDFCSTSVPLPPLPEQKRIAAYLDASCAAIDRAVESKKKQLETLDALRKSIITPAVLSGLERSRPMQNTGNAWLASIPVGWKLAALKRVSETQTGITLGKAYEPPLIERPYLRAANVQDGYLDLEKITTIEIPANLVTRYELRSGDVLMTEGGDLDKLGRGFPWEGQIEGCLHQNHVFAIRTNPRLLLSKFLAYVTASRYGRDYFEATGKRTTNLASTNSTKVGLLPVPLPPVSEQQAIVDHLDEKLEQVGQVESAISSQIATLTAYRKSLIHECVTGKRRISDADVAKVEAHV